MSNNDIKGLVGLTANEVKLILRSFDVVEDTEGSSTHLMNDLTFRLFKVLNDIQRIENDIRDDLTLEETAEVSRR